MDIGKLKRSGLAAIITNGTEEEIALERVYDTSGVYKGSTCVIHIEIF